MNEIESECRFALRGCKRFSYYRVPDYRGKFRFHPFYNKSKTISKLKPFIYYENENGEEITIPQFGIHKEICNKTQEDLQDDECDENDVEHNDENRLEKGQVSRKTLVEIFKPYVVFKLYTSEGHEIPNAIENKKNVIKSFELPFQEDFYLLQKQITKKLQKNSDDHEKEHETNGKNASSEKKCSCYNFMQNRKSIYRNNKLDNEQQVIDNELVKSSSITFYSTLIHRDENLVRYANKIFQQLYCYLPETGLLKVENENEIVSKKKKIAHTKKQNHLNQLKGLNFVFNSKVNEYVCKDCGNVLMQGSNKNEKDAYERSHSTNKIPSSYYDPRNNWRDQMTKKQARENIFIHPDIIKTIATAFLKDGLDERFVTQKLLRRYLRKLGPKYFKYQNNVPKLQKELIGYRPNQFTAEQDLIYCLHFEQFVKIYHLIKNPNRSSLLNTNVLGYKICELFGWEDHMKFFPLIGDSKILEPQLDVWYEACELLNWTKIITRI